jgi:hypothetical protein
MGWLRPCRARSELFLPLVDQRVAPAIAIGDDVQFAGRSVSAGVFIGYKEPVSANLPLCARYRLCSGVPDGSAMGYPLAETPPVGLRANDVPDDTHSSSCVHSSGSARGQGPDLGSRAGNDYRANGDPADPALQRSAWRRRPALSLMGDRTDFQEINSDRS